MKKVSEWLDENYPDTEKGKSFYEIHIKEELTGELDLPFFNTSSLFYIYLYPNLDHSKLKFINQGSNFAIAQMIDGQKWLDNYYPQNGTCIIGEDYEENGKERKEISYLSISGKDLTASLNLTGFINLKSFFCSGNHLNSLDSSECLNLEHLDCSSGRINKIKNLTLPSTKSLIKLYCYENEIAKLDLLRNPNLEVLLGFENQLNQLLISEDNQLNNIIIRNNYLTSFDFSRLNSITLTKLFLNNNDLEPTNIKVFSKLIKLIELYIGNDDDWVKSGKYNKFYGSLEAFKNMNQLEILSIDNTNIFDGMEHLPEDLEEFSCNYLENSDFKVKGIEEQLKLQLHPDEHYESRNWKPYWRKWKEKKTEERLRKQWEIELEQEQTEKLKTLSLSETVTSTKPTINNWIGEGGFANAYRGVWNNQNVAIKKYKYSLHAIKPNEVKLINDEVSLMKSLRNRYIIQYYSLYHDSNDLMVIMELAEYGSLINFLKRNKNSEHDWGLNYNLISQITRGLQYLHSNNIIHRDLKSPNVLITEGYIAKLSDFGLSKITNELELVKSGTVNHVGTPRWWAPEIFTQKKPHSFNTDVYSLGLIIWEIVAKEIPFKDLDNMLIMMAFIKGEQEIIPTYCPEDIKEIIEGCWKENPNKRIKLSKILSKFKELEVVTESFNDLESYVEVSFI